MRAEPLGVVVAGGLSSRMGTDKALVSVAGRTLAQGAADRLAPLCSEVVLADRGRGVVPGLPSIPDGPGRGPAAGLLGAAGYAGGHPLLVLACDLPSVPGALLAALVRRGHEQGADCALARTPRGIEPLAGVYGPRALEALETQVAGGHYALWRLVERPELAIAWIEGEELAAFGDPAALFFNVNTPDDLARFRA